MPKTVDLASAGLRPWILRAINSLWPSGDEIDADRLIRSAVRRAGLEDFGEEWSDVPLRTLVDAINAEASLSAIGRFIMVERIRGAMVTRLRAVDTLKSHPEITKQPVAPIWLISGLQRTGTTYLQRLLGGDPTNRSLYSWESLDPVPHGDRNETARRIRMARLSERALRWISPAFFAIHPVDHNGPEEDVLLLDPAFMSTAPEALMHVPSFGRWLERQDQTIAYRWEKKMLQLLQWQRPATRWILKSPHHLEHLQAFIQVFPETKVIWTHRDPVETLPSFMSMVYHGRAMFSQRVSTEQVRQQWLRKSSRMITQALAFRQSNSQAMADVPFPSLVLDAESAVENIYKTFGFCLSENARHGVQRVMQGHRKDRFGTHAYDAQAFGLEHQEIRDTFRDYYSLLNELDVPKG